MTKLEDLSIPAGTAVAGCSHCDAQMAVNPERWQLLLQHHDDGSHTALRVETSS